MGCSSSRVIGAIGKGAEELVSERQTSIFQCFLITINHFLSQVVPLEQIDWSKGCRTIVKDFPVY